MGAGTPRHDPKPQRTMSGGPHCPQHPARQDDAPRSADDARAWRQQQIEPRRGAVSITIINATWRRLRHHLRDQDPPAGGKGGTARGYLLLCLFLSIVYLRSFPWPIKGEVGRPIRGSSFGIFFRSFRSTSTSLHFSPETWELISLDRL
jgi:hypothetical protein